MAIIVPQLSPVAFSLGGIDIRWYALAYLTAFILGFYLMRKMAKKTGVPDDKKFWDDIMFYGILGIILGGRIGYCLVYNFNYYIANPAEILAIWHGGMSFHGGALGFLLAMILFARIRKANWLKILDLGVVVAPIGLFLGRIANFINMELMGRATESPLGIIFEGNEIQYPRHPSPLYEACLEGLLLFIIMNLLFYRTKLREQAGKLTGIFVVLYAIFRIFAEQFRTPDSNLGFVFAGLTMGQILSIIMIFVGIFLFYFENMKKRLGRK